MNPYVSDLYAQFSGHLSVKPMEDFGGTANWVLMTLGFSLIFDFFLIFLFISVYNYLPGNAAVKGLLFGVTIVIIKAIPEAFNQFMIFKYPEILIIVQLVNTIIGITLFGIYMSIIFTRLKVFIPKQF